MTTYEILRQCYYWLGMFKDNYKWIAQCEKCKMFIGKPQLATFPLRPIVIEGPFQQWGIDFIGPINPSSSARHSYIITAIDYFTKCVEAKPTKKSTSQVVSEFIKESILVRFGVPLKLVMDNATYFSSVEIVELYYDYTIHLSYSSYYFPQENGQVESSNIFFINIMRKLVSNNHKYWHKKLYEALWENKVTPKKAIDISPFKIVYGVEASLPLPLELSVYKLRQIVEDLVFQTALEK